MQQKVDISVVTTLYNAAPFIEKFYQRASSSVKKLTDSYEIIFVNDGSPDNSALKVDELILRDNRVILANLSKNFGHHHALKAGLDIARGDRIFLIDVDLEESPEWLLELDREMESGDFDAVYTVQAARKGNLFERISGAFFYRLFNKFSDTRIPFNACTARLMKRDYVNAILRTRDKNLFIGGIFSWVGFRQKYIQVNKESLHNSTYSFSKKLSMTADAITSFSSKPLKMVFILGFIIAVLSLLFGFSIFLRKLIYPGSIISGWASLMVSIWFLGGLIIMFVGGVGLYVAKIFIEVKDRPTYIIRDIRRRK